MRGHFVSSVACAQTFSASIIPFFHSTLLLFKKRANNYLRRYSSKSSTPTMSAASTCEQNGLDPPCFWSILRWYIQRVSCRKYFNQSTLGLWVSLTGFCQNRLFRWKRLTSNLFCTDSIVFNLSSHTFDALICCQVLYCAKKIEASLCYKNMMPAKK